MGRRITAMTLVGLEDLYRDALHARAEVQRIPQQDAATEEAAALLGDIASAAAWWRFSNIPLGKMDKARRAEFMKSGG